MPPRRLREVRSPRAVDFTRAFDLRGRRGVGFGHEAHDTGRKNFTLIRVEGRRRAGRLKCAEFIAVP